MRKTRRRDSEQAAIVKKTAKIVGCSVGKVYKVIRGDQWSTVLDKKIMDTYMFFSEGEKNLFIQAVEKLIPVN